MADEGTPAEGAPAPGVDDGHAAEVLAQTAAKVAAAEPQMVPASEAERWKSYARKHEDNLKTTNLKLKELMDRDKSEADRLRDENAANAERATAAERKVWRLEAADDFSIPKSFRGSISGDTEDEIRESARALQEAIAEVRGSVAAEVPSGGGANGNGQPQQPARPARGRSRRPVESMQSGALPASTPAGNAGDPNDWFRGLVEEKLGRR